MSTTHDKRLNSVTVLKALEGDLSQELVHRPLDLVTGPTSSGKTTTLYSSAIGTMNTLGKNLLTIEEVSRAVHLNECGGVAAPPSPRFHKGGCTPGITQRDFWHSYCWATA